MNLQTESIITEPARKELRKQLAVTACGAALTVAALAGIGAWQATAHGGASKSVAAPAPAARVITRARSPQLLSYDLVGSQEQADQWKSQKQSNPYVEPAGHVFVVVSTLEQEMRVRKEVDEANTMEASGERFIQVVDLRPNQLAGSEAAAPAQ